MISVLIEKGYVEETLKCLKAGYVLPKNLLLDAIRDENYVLCRKIIEGSFYESSDN